MVARSFRHADLALVLNDAEAEHLDRRLGMASRMIRRMRLGTDHAGIRIEDRRRLPGGVVQIGAYAARKGIAVTARSMIRAMSERPSITLAFIGTGVPRSVVLADYPAHLHSRIEVVERYSNAALPGLLASRSICLMPSLFEGYGLAKLEAMACGLAVVVSDDEGARTDIVNGITGLVVPRGDDAALASAVMALVDHPERADALGRTGMAMASRFSWQVVASERIDLYREGLARAATAS
jgi:glycosyltransferase involved in cell wall biosynthesis